MGTITCEGGRPQQRRSAQLFDAERIMAVWTAWERWGSAVEFRLVDFRPAGGWRLSADGEWVVAIRRTGSWMTCELQSGAHLQVQPDDLLCALGLTASGSSARAAERTGT